HLQRHARDAGGAPRVPGAPRREFDRHVEHRNRPALDVIDPRAGRERPVLDAHLRLCDAAAGEEQDEERGAQGVHQCPARGGAAAALRSPSGCGSSTATVNPSSVMYFFATATISSAVTSPRRSRMRSTSRYERPTLSSVPSSIACAKIESRLYTSCATCRAFARRSSSSVTPSAATRPTISRSAASSSAALRPGVAPASNESVAGPRAKKS